MAKKQALRPGGGFFTTLPTFIQEEQARERGVTLEEELYHSLSLHGGWRQFREYINNLLADLDQGTAAAMEQGLPFEEIGRNAVVIDLAKGIIKKAIAHVDDAREAVEEADGKE